MIFTSLRTKPLALLVAAGLMLGSVVAAEWAKPNKHYADVTGVPHYDQIIPTAFGDWQMLKASGGAVVNPVQEQRLMELYTETLARAYVHKPTGRVLMLSVAYGKDQSTDTQIHTPEACYPSQGFKVVSREHHDIKTAHATVPAVRMVTTLGDQRTEPLTYFIRVGDGMARGSRDRNLARLSMAVKGLLMDGMLFRVSEVSKDPGAFSLQDTFIQDLLGHLGQSQRERIIGKTGA